MADPTHFEGQAASYGQARPPYPAELWSRLQSEGLLQAGHRALDLGAGTGQATGPLLAADLEVTAVEPGPQLAAQIQAMHPAATVVVARAEDVPLEAQAFDLVVAATSIHWMDLDVVLPKVHRALHHDGRFAVWRHVFGDPNVSTPFRGRVAEIVRERAAPPRPSPDPQDPTATRVALTRTGLFAAEEMCVFRWSIELDDVQVHRLFSTFSDWTEHEVDRAAAAARELGGRTIEHYQSWLILLRPQHPPPR